MADDLAVPLLDAAADHAVVIRGHAQPVAAEALSERAQQILPAVIHGEGLTAHAEDVHRVDEVIPAVVGQGNGKVPLRAHGDLDPP